MVSTTQNSLALYGGDRVRATPFPQRGHIGLEEKAAVDALFDRAIETGIAPNYNGDEENAYCAEFAEYLGGGYADAVNSGTAAIYVALKSLNLPPFSEVIVAAVTDPGGLMPVPLLNLIPVIADTLPESYNTGPEQIEALISPLTSAILVAHIAGEPVDMAGIMAVARRHNLPVVEDCAQAHGARLNGQIVGTFGDIGAFSTMSGKHHSTGSQGGVVFTQREALYHEIRRNSDRGKPFFLPTGSTNPTASLNLNLNDFAATIGRVQLKKLPDINARRQIIVSKLGEGLDDLATVSLPSLIAGAEAVYWFLRLRFHADQATCDKETYTQALIAEGLPVNPSYRAALPHTQSWFEERRVFGAPGYPWSSPDYQGDPERRFPCPNAQAAMATYFNLQIHENWGEQEVEDAVAIFQRVDKYFRRG
ncbi:MAG: DegT/DnrJ/EryC1/StrS family aminotransferase [Caldilineaceae bacterium]|nr:DegT/DnrJ/EryC1/StrS family aminotransferase [Caldilineaceae bacterium]